MYTVRSRYSWKTRTVEPPSWGARQDAARRMGTYALSEMGPPSDGGCTLRTATGEAGIVVAEYIHRSASSIGTVAIAPG